MPDRLLRNEFYIFLTKIIFPAFLAVGIKIAIEMKKNKFKISFFNICLSMVIGVGGAYISSDYIIHQISKDYVSIVIALVAITSEKIGEFLIYKLNVDLFLSAFVDSIISVLTKKK
jgi:hypothetical protein